MVNSSTNINQITISLLLEPLNRKNIRTYGVGNKGPGLGYEQNVAGLNWLMWSQPATADNSNSNKYNSEINMK